MKKFFCLTLIVLSLLFVFTGCTGTAYTTNGNGRNGGYTQNGRNDQGNVSTSRDGTVNGRNNGNMPRMGMGVEIGTGRR